MPVENFQIFRSPISSLCASRALSNKFLIVDSSKSLIETNYQKQNRQSTRVRVDYVRTA